MIRIQRVEVIRPDGMSRNDSGNQRAQGREQGGNEWGSTWTAEGRTT